MKKFVSNDIGNGPSSLLCNHLKFFPSFGYYPFVEIIYSENLLYCNPKVKKIVSSDIGTGPSSLFYNRLKFFTSFGYYPYFHSFEYVLYYLLRNVPINRGLPNMSCPVTASSQYQIATLMKFNRINGTSMSSVLEKASTAFYSPYTGSMIR